MPNQQYAEAGQVKDSDPVEKAGGGVGVSDSAKSQSEELRSARFKDIPQLEAAFAGQGLIGYGSKGKAVVAIQQSLTELGNDAGKADGIWGGKTSKALMAFQASRGLGADGKLGTNSMRALDAADASIGAKPLAEKPPMDKKAEESEQKGEDEPKKELEKEVADIESEKPVEKKPAEKTPAEKTPEEEKSVVTVPPEQKSEAEALRAAIAGNAEEWNGKEFMTQAEIDKVRKNANMPNYTTCIDFAGKMMRESVGGLYGSDPKKAQQTAQMLSQIKGDWEKGVGASIQAEHFKKAAQKYEDSIAELEERKAKQLETIANLRRPAEEGEAEYTVKARHKQADILEKQVIKTFDTLIAQQQKHRDSWQAKADKKTGEAAELDANNPAMIKTQPGMTNGRPKVGEYIILAQAPGGGTYSAGNGPTVNMAGGMFKHIAIFMGAKEVKPGVEEWRTIDGGGTHGKETILYIRTENGLVYRTPDFKDAEPGKPWTGTPAKNVIAGWIDTEMMIAMRDAKNTG